MKRDWRGGESRDFEIERIRGVTKSREGLRKKQARQLVTVGPEFRRAGFYLGSVWRRRPRLTTGLVDFGLSGCDYREQPHQALKTS